MAEFNCLITLDDADQVASSLSRSELVLVDDGRSARPDLTEVSAAKLFEPNPYPHGACAYFSKDLNAVAVAKIARRGTVDDFFFVVEDLYLPEHLNVSVFLRDVSHIGDLGVSHHATFLTKDGLHTTSASEALKRVYRSIREHLARHAVVVDVVGKRYFVMPGAFSAIAAQRATTTQGAPFDQSVIAALQGQTRSRS